MKEVLFAAQDLADEEREAFLHRECAADPRLRADVETMLVQLAKITGFLDKPILAEASAEESDFVPHIPGFDAQRLLGRGGMGSVFLARQQRPARDVALKLLVSPHAGEAARRRFEREIAALSRLEHPGIARIYAAGEWPHAGESYPWFAMELVDGLDIVEYARRNGLDVGARVQLIIDLCAAMTHAHEHGVLHRDLKPDNVLVDGEGRVRVLDFGVARLADVPGVESTFRTQSGLVVGTLAYMAPEQADAGSAAVSERSDLYSVGVILYELLTGQLPIPLRGVSVHEALRRLVEVDPVRAGALDAGLRGDLEHILTKTLEKEPGRRYRSVTDLSRDLERWTAHRPISARPPSWADRGFKFVRRHRAASLGVIATVLALSLGLVRALVAEAHAREQRDSLLQLETGRRLSELRATSDDLWPANEDNVSALHDWVVRGRELVERLPDLSSRLSRLEADVEGALPGSTPEERQWAVSEQRRVVLDLEAFAEARTGLLAQMTHRYELARTARARTVDDLATQWAEATRALADPTVAPSYGGLLIEPQVGLIPLGPDARSGLWEFALADWTGEAPSRIGSSTELVIGEESGIVLVLIPGGESLVGGQNSDRDGRRFDPGAVEHHGGLQRVRLDPFFVSKCEVTQGQWERVMGDNPSWWEVGSIADGITTDRSHPVESVSWVQCVEFCGRLGLLLPTEAQWEVSARGGTDTRYPWGDDPFCLDEAANFRKDTTNSTGWPWTANPFLVHAPVATFSPNGYGLHDVLGNVAEWCRDGYEGDRLVFELRDGDGLRVTEESEHRPIRGGSFQSDLAVLRLLFRTDAEQTTSGPHYGLRPVRPIDGRWSRSPGGD